MKKMLIISIFFSMFACNYQNDKQHLSITATQNLLQSEDMKLEKIEKMFEGYSKDFPMAVNITPKEALNLNNTVYVDVREDKEIQISILPGAISKSEFEKNKKKYQDSNIVVYCTIGYRSGIFTEEVSEEGFKAFNLKGGVLLWSHAGLDFFKNDVLTRDIHVYGSQWDLAHKDYKTTY